MKALTLRPSAAALRLTAPKILPSSEIVVPMQNIEIH
jgi:hypothetical protein